MKKTQFILALAFCLLSQLAHAQKPDLTTVSGTVIDAVTGETLPFVDMYFAGTTYGGNTDADGYFELKNQYATEYLVASYLGYEPDTVQIILGQKNNNILIKLGTGAVELIEIEVKAEKKRYKNKNNPAVQLIKDILANRDKNRTSEIDYYEYEQYEKIELDINNITDNFRNSRAFRKLPFIFDYVDTSAINGKPYLPIYLRETISDVYQRGEPQAKKEYIKAVRHSGIEEYLKDGSISSVLERLYYDIDIYDSNIELLAQNFTSPIAPIAPQVYKYYILDTIQFNNREVYNLAFLPRNKLDFAFKGNMYVTMDGNYTVVKVDMTVDNDINLNWVRDIAIDIEFEKHQGEWIKSVDRTVIDYAIGTTGTGFFGRRNVERRKQKIGEPRDGDFYEGAENTVRLKNARRQTDEYWDEARFTPLNDNEEGIYYMIDTLVTVPAFRRTMDLVKVLSSGYLTRGAFDIGPIGTIYSFNDIEGTRIRLGGRTTTKFSEKWNLAGYGAYGFRDKRWKGSLGVMHSFNTSYDENPVHFIRAGIKRETEFPGQELQFINEDNFILSIRRGPITRMTMYDSYQIDYRNETRGPFTYDLNFQHRTTEPLGNLKFEQINTLGEPGTLIEDVTTTSFSAGIKYAPNEEFFQGQEYRTPLFNRWPIMTLKYTTGVKGLLGGDYNFHRVDASVFKRFYLSLLGVADVQVEAGKIFGKVPFILTNLPRANQTYSYQLFSYNLMNFLEFTSDEWVSLNYQHYFNGLFFNRVPLLKKLKLREVMSIKALYGRLTDGNNPNLTEGLFALPVYEDGESDGIAAGTPYTNLFDNVPYVEGSVGVMNIFKLFRVDLVKRFTYLDLPNTPELFGVNGLGIRARLKVEF